MAENHLKTTSSKGFNEKTAHTMMPHHGQVRKMEPDQVSKRKQSFQPEIMHENEDLHALVLSKNKLKRKKKLSVSLTSVGDTVNQEKRTRIEGIHLNIRSRQETTANSTTADQLTIHSTTANLSKVPAKQTTERKVERPVIIGGVNVLSTAPQRFKRKLQENVDTIQKLNALAEQLRLEVNELKSSLITERSAVRALRAQNDADSRKWRSEVKKLQHTLETTKKSNVMKKPNELTSEANNSQVAGDGLINYEIQRLTNEIAVLKEANKTKEEKTQIIGQADRRKAADMRQLKTAYENRLTQIQKSAKIEITRLLEEIKTKERHVGQLKKDLQLLQNGKRFSTEAKTKPKTNETSLSQKLKKPTTKLPITTSTSTQTQTHLPTTITIATNTNTINEADILPNPLNQAQVTAEITQLKNIELINNTKNVHKSTLEMRATIATKERDHDEHEQRNQEDDDEIVRDERTEQTIIATTPTTATPTTWMETLTTKPTTREYRSKDNNSDTDSALSSAPPSISPQPPSSGADSGVMWQALQDLDKLQKEVEIYHKENDRLQTELQLMKQELINAEKVTLSVTNSNNTHINELLQRNKDMEEQHLQLASEANELREQNELLEFRILELEDDKMDGTCEDQCQRLENLLRRSSQQLEDREKRCLQQLLQCVQHLDLDAMADQDSWQSSVIGKSDRGTRQSSSRIVATVQPYSNSATPSAPTTPSKQLNRSCNIAWHNSSLSESGVFVECDTDREADRESSRLEPHPHLVYYQERLIQLEGKLLVYESSGETQAKHLAERLQREVELNKQVKDLIERVELLVEQNAQLEEAKCEFEEAENDTRLHLQRNEEELEILRQRNVELEFSKDALGAKYRECRAECLILRDDLCAAETRLEQLQAERQLAKEQLESLRRSLPLLLIWRILALASKSPPSPAMGSEQSSPISSRAGAGCKTSSCPKFRPRCGQPHNSPSQPRNEVNCLKEEVKTLRTCLQDLKTRHYEAMEMADSHWVDLERDYKAREDAYRTKEACLKQKIGKLQDCLREDSRAAAEKIQQLEETEQGLKKCLVRLTKEHRDLIERYCALEKEVEAKAAQDLLDKEKLGPITEELENEKRRNQAMMDDLTFAQKLQKSMEEQLQAETDALRQQIYDLKKEFMHIEVTNGELKEEVGTLETKIAELEQQLKDCGEHANCLEDELRTKDEQIQLMERKLGACPEGHSLADELYDSPEKRAKREEIANLETATQGLGCALRDLERRERELPTHKDFQTIACSVKQLADTILSAQNPEVSGCGCEAAIDVCDTFGIVGKAEGEAKEKGQVEGETEETVGIQKNAGVEGEAEAEVEAEAKVEQREAAEEIQEVQTPQTDGVAPAEKRESGGFILNNGFDSFGHNLKSQLFRVPLTLLQMVCGDGTPVTEPGATPRASELRDLKLLHKRLQCKIFVSRRLYRGRVRRSGACAPPAIQARNRRVATSQAEASEGTTVDNSSSLYESIDSQRQLAGSLLGTQSQLVQASPEMKDQQQQTESRITHAQQQQLDVEQRMQLVPTRTRNFLHLLEAQITDADHSDVEEFRARVLHLWESSEEFREHLELLQDLCGNKDAAEVRTGAEADPSKSYDIFVGVMGCVRALKCLVKPKDSQLLQQLEQDINERLTDYHNQKVESDFYFRVCVPLTRDKSENPILDGTVASKLS